jgi:predicted TIM-barrel fold metal-dependent hydrolase
MDKDWRPTRRETPWMKRLPSSYLRTHVRFCADPFESPDDLAVLGEWLEMTDARDLLLFASNYPHWDFFDPRHAFKDVEEGLRRRVMGENASALYGLAAGA